MRLTGKDRGTSRLAHQLRRTRSAILLQKKLSAAIVALIAGLLCLAIGPFARAHMQAIAVLDQVSGHPVPRIVGDFVADPITVKDLTIPAESGFIRARIYLPVSKPNAPALIVLHGVHHLGIDEPRLQSFAAAMASCGLRVLTPELPSIKDYRVGTDSIRTIGESVRWLARSTGSPVGVMGLSFAGGLALLAAADPLYHPDFKFVLAVGSQGSMGRVTQYYRTGQDARPNGTTEVLPAHEYGPLVIEYEHLEDFVSPPDIAPIRAVLRAHLYEDVASEKSALAQLTPQQHTEAMQLMAASSPATRSQLAASEAKHSGDMAGLSPDSKLHSLTTPVYLLHGEADNIIPSAETLWMASELPSETLQAMLVSPVISHLDINARPTLFDRLCLIHFFALVLHAAEKP